MALWQPVQGTAISGRRSATCTVTCTKPPQDRSPMRCAMTSSVRLRPPNAPLVQSRTACDKRWWHGDLSFNQLLRCIHPHGGVYIKQGLRRRRHQIAHSTFVWDASPSCHLMPRLLDQRIRRSVHIGRRLVKCQNGGVLSRRARASRQGEQHVQEIGEIAGQRTGRSNLTPWLQCQCTLPTFQTKNTAVRPCLAMSAVPAAAHAPGRTAGAGPRSGCPPLPAEGGKGAAAACLQPSR